VRSGDHVEVRISGNQAAEALEGILALAARHFDEPLTGPAAAPPQASAAPVRERLDEST
jgi:hypothetical protein